MPVAELVHRVSWQEMRHWIAFYTWEGDQQLPPGKRPIRPQNADEAAAALERMFGIPTT